MEFLKSPQFAGYMQGLIDHHHVKGTAIALVRNDEISSVAFGKASMQPPKAFTPDSLVPIGSLSKSLTAAAVAQLVSDNENYQDVQYGASMASLLEDDFVMPGTEHDDVTVEDILSHQTGMPPHDFSLFGPRAQCPDTARSITRNLRNLSPVAPNRAEFVYCNMMYTVITHLIEKKTKLAFGDFLESCLLQPLQMNSTALFQSRVDDKGLAGRIATGYVRCKKTGGCAKVMHHESPETQGSSEIFSSANDCAKWIKALINCEGPITKAIYEDLTKKRVRTDISEDDDVDESLRSYYAFGWDVGQYEGHTVYSHLGSEVGYRSVQFFMPHLKVGGVILTNSHHADAFIGGLKYRLMHEMISGSSLGEFISVTDDSLTPDDDDDDDGSEDSVEQYYREMEEEVRQELCPGIKGTQPQELPLKAYLGQYRNPGYRTILVEEQNGALVVNAQDRSVGFTLTFKHVSDQTKYIAVLHEGAGSNDHILEAEFVLEGKTATKVGIWLEEQLDYKIWFERV